MAGIKGMATPNDLKQSAEPTFPISEMPAPAQNMSQVPVQQAQAKPSLDEIFADEQQRPSLDEIFAESSAPAPSEFAVNLPTSEQRFGASAGDLLQGLANPIYALGKMASGGFGELPARARAALQVTDKEIKQSLELSFGKDNVRGSGDSVEYKGKDGKWRVWDAGLTVEDFTVDQLRPVIEEAPAAAATLAASVPAFATAVGTGGLGIPLAGLQLAGARAGGAVAGQAVADWMQSLTGVTRDEERSAVLEYGLSAVLAPVAGFAGDWVTKKIAARALKNQALPLMSPAQLFKDEIGSAKEALDVIKQYGGMENIPGTNTPITLAQLNPSNPIAVEITKEASSLNKFKQAQEFVSQSFDNASKNFLKMIGMSDDINKTGQKFTDYVAESLKQEGQIIGDVRSLLVDQAGNAELPIPKLKNKVETFARDLGFNLTGENNPAQIVQGLVDNGYKQANAEVLVKKVNKMLESVSSKEGRLTAKELLGSYEELNGMYRNLVRGGSEMTPLFKQKVGEFRRFFADELIDKAGVLADKPTQTKYVNSLARYKELTEAGDEFAALLDKNNVASSSLSKSIFSKGANALDTANAAKTLLKDRPDLFGEIGGSYLQDLTAKNTKNGKINWQAVFKETNDPQLKEVMNIVFGENHAAAFKSFKKISDTIEAGKVTFDNPLDRANLTKDLVAAVKNAVYGLKAILGVFSETGPGKAFAQSVNDVGIEEFIKTAPKDVKPLLVQSLDQFLNATKVTAYPVATYVGRTGKEMSRQEANRKNEK